MHTKFLFFLIGPSLKKLKPFSVGTPQTKKGLHFAFSKQEYTSVFL